MKNLLACVYEKVNLYAFFKKITKICHTYFGENAKNNCFRSKHHSAVSMQMLVKYLPFPQAGITIILMTKDLAQIIKV